MNDQNNDTAATDANPVVLGTMPGDGVMPTTTRFNAEQEEQIVQNFVDGVYSAEGEDASQAADVADDENFSFPDAHPGPVAAQGIPQDERPPVDPFDRSISFVMVNPNDPDPLASIQSMLEDRLRKGQGLNPEIEIIKAAIFLNPDYAWAWLQSVVKSAVECGVDNTTAHWIGATFMRDFVAVDMRKHPLFAEFDQPAAEDNPAEVGDAHDRAVEVVAVPAGDADSDQQ